MTQPTRQQVRTMYCQACGATLGHPCVEYRNNGKHDKYIGHTRESNHRTRIEEYSQSETEVKRGGI
jgi:hypothetical protein